MNQVLSTPRRLLAATALVSLCALSHADPMPQFVPFDGAGNVLVIDAAAGTGAWTGSIEQSSFPATPSSPLSLVSVVVFQFDAAQHTLSGSFEFTIAADLASTLFGKVSGNAFNADILSSGGQFGIDYTILGGTGAYATASGYGLSFVDFDPTVGFNNYAEAGQLVVTVPEPGTMALALSGLALLAASGAGRRLRGATTWPAAAMRV